MVTEPRTRQGEDNPATTRLILGAMSRIEALRPTTMDGRRVRREALQALNATLPPAELVYARAAIEEAERAMKTARTARERSRRSADLAAAHERLARALAA